MIPSSRPSLALVLSLIAVLPPIAHARAEAGTKIDNVELKTLAGGREKLLSESVRANIFVFFRTGQERSSDALKQMAQCEKDLAGKSIHWAAVVSSTEPVDDVRALVKEAGIQMPVLLDEGDRVYDLLKIRLHPMVGIVDQNRLLQALEPYRQIDYCEIIKTRIKILLGEATVADLERALDPPKSALPGRDDPMKKAMRDVNMARRLVEIGEPDKALKQAQKALEVAPVAGAFVVMGEAYAKMGKCVDSRKALDQAGKLDPKNPDLVAARALCAGK
ncbi:MAG TPA: hypothetical protein VML50_07645 [Anaeromyxobacter sp.]|nr:hypothetical protein [Anaeromyxobacter sp.]